MKLDLFRRPVVLFDPSNKQHRRDYGQFLSTGAWRHTDVRYVINDVAGDLQARIQRQLLEYYIDREFVAKKPQKNSG
jgi:hypothetical protein